MTTATASEIRAHLSDLLSRWLAAEIELWLPAAARNMPPWFLWMTSIFSKRLESRLDLEDAKKALKEPGSVPWKKVKAELGL